MNIAVSGAGPGASPDPVARAEFSGFTWFSVSDLGIEHVVVAPLPVPMLARGRLGRK